MEIKLTHKMINEMCGAVSFKRGDSFYRADKVMIKTYHPNFCEAIVIGTEDFHVTIEKDDTGDIHTLVAVHNYKVFKRVANMLRLY